MQCVYYIYIYIYLDIRICNSLNNLLLYIYSISLFDIYVSCLFDCIDLYIYFNQKYMSCPFFLSMKAHLSFLLTIWVLVSIHPIKKLTYLLLQSSCIVDDKNISYISRTE